MLTLISLAGLEVSVVFVVVSGDLVLFPCFLLGILKGGRRIFAPRPCATLQVKAFFVFNQSPFFLPLRQNEGKPGKNPDPDLSGFRIHHGRIPD